MPHRDHTESYGPIAGILPDRCIPVVHQLIAVVFEFLAEEIQHGPALMTRRTAQTVFSGKRRERTGGLGCTQDEEGENKCENQGKLEPVALVAEMTLRAL